ncbi:acyl carrier protein [Rhizobium sp. XQZ8]|uniref:acyl carrier protein n=1 Tax=Rhizobium populisoli TaxID=2859785 RepID=UPI001CA48FBD|nr:acyl carrier protein [Rhizobium populisoli]MBW6424206.1 acyl carrier protein [Rhizobium populisoli]
MENTFSRLSIIISTRLGVSPEKIVQSASFKDDLGADSLEIVEIFMAVEDEFDLEIQDEEMDAITTVGDAVRFLENAKTRAA